MREQVTGLKNIIWVIRFWDIIGQILGPFEVTHHSNKWCVVPRAKHSCRPTTEPDGYELWEQYKFKTTENYKDLFIACNSNKFYFVFIEMLQLKLIMELHPSHDVSEGHLKF